MNKKVLHIITTLDPGGAEKQLLEMIRAFRPDYTHEIIWVKGPGKLKSTLSDYSIEANSLKVKLKHLICELAKGRHSMYSSKYIIHAHLPRAELLAVLLSFVWGSRLVVSKHNMERMWPHGPKSLSRILAKIVYRRATRVICISKAVRNFLIAIGELEVESNKLSVVYYGIASNGENNFTNQATVKYKPGEVIRIGTLARLEPQKDLKTLVKAAALLRDQGVKAHFQVHGEGTERFKLESLVRSLNLEDYVSIGQKLEYVGDFFRDIDLFVLPSLYEGFGLVILEAAQKGVPVLLSETDVAKELVGTSTELTFPIGDYVQLANKILHLFSHSNELLCLKARTFDIIAKFDIELTITQMVAIYES